MWGEYSSAAKGYLRQTILLELKTQLIESEVLRDEIFP